MRSDESLLERLRGGDLAAFDELYIRYERPLFGFVLHFLKDRAEAEEIFQDAFVAVLRQRPDQQPVQSFRAWIYGVARNLCLNKLRTRSRAARALERVVHEQHAAPPNPDTDLCERELLSNLERAVAKLPSGMAELYALRAGGLSYKELADTLGVPIGTVKSRMSTMLVRLRMEMSDEL